MTFFQGLINLVKHPFFGQEHRIRSVVQQVELQIFVREPRNVNDNSFFYFSSFEHGGHAMVSCDYNIQMVTESVFLSCFLYLAQSSVNFFDCLGSWFYLPHLHFFLSGKCPQW